MVKALLKRAVGVAASLLHIQTASALGWTSDATFNNARPSTVAADPYVRWDAKTNQYWAYSTEGADDGWLFGIYTSPDLATWHKQPGGAIKQSNESRIWADDWFWAPECYYNERTGWYFFFYAGRFRDPKKIAAYFKYPDFDEASKIGVAVSRNPGGPFINIADRPIDYYPFDPDYSDINLLMSPPYLVPPATLEEGEKAPKGTFIPHIDANVFWDDDGSIWLFFSRNAYRNWVWSDEFKRYIEESNIYAVRLDDAWWHDPLARTLPAVHRSFRDTHKGLPKGWQTSVNESFPGPTRKDGWVPIISYKLQPQVWENAHVFDYEASKGTRKNRRWSEGSTTIKRRDSSGAPIYYLTYSANNFESPDYGVGYAYSNKVSGPYVKSPSNPILSQDPSKSIYSTGHGSIVGAQGKEGPGSELYYVHHGRPSTTAGRYMYNARLFIEPDTLYMGFGPSAGDLRIPRGVAPYSIKAKSTSQTSWDISVQSANGASFDLSNPANRLNAWVDGDSGAQVSVKGGSVSISGVSGRNAKLYVSYQRARVNETEPWKDVAQTQGLGDKWQPVQTVISLRGYSARDDEDVSAEDDVRAEL